ncbi:MAG: phage holin family protein [Acetobacteraceae bacterium]|nr:phage holin family protein [Acetobacteraceae bacterium]
MGRMMRLLRVAAQAEGLRWRRTGRAYAIRAGLGAGALVFALLLVFMLHMALFAWIARGQGPVVAALIVAGLDLVIAGIMGWLAARGGPDPIAVEAEHVRDDALRQVGDQAARAAVILPVVRSASMKKGLVGAALTAAVVGLIARR